LLLLRDRELHVALTVGYFALLIGISRFDFDLPVDAKRRRRIVGDIAQHILSARLLHEPLERKLRVAFG